MKNLLKNFFDVFSYVLFPKICFYCKKPLTLTSLNILCENCFNQIKLIDNLVCKKCGVILESGGEHCFDCRTSKRKTYFDFVRGAVEYKEPVKTLIHEFKYQNKYFLKKFLISIMCKWWEKNSNIFPSIDVVCCVPMNTIKKFFRGYNQAELLACEFAKKYNFNFQPNLIKRKKFTISQFRLSKEERLENVKDAFKVNNKLTQYIKGKNILIIDDICTTAETINQCAKVLKHSGARAVFGFVLARDI